MLKKCQRVDAKQIVKNGGLWLPACENCGAELKEDAKFCAHCGVPVGTETTQRPEPVVERVRTRKRKEACFGPPGSGGGLWGVISFGVFVMGLGILWLFDFFWPGILFLIGLMMVIGALAAFSRR
jgi:hypothetical protein